MAHPQRITASVFKEAYEVMVIHNTPGIPNEADWEEFEKRRLAEQERQKKALAENKPGTYGGNCVTFAKNYLGVYGTWGDGGRRLSLNSGPVPGAVIIFEDTVHVGVVLRDQGLAVTYIDSNYVAKNTVGVHTILKTSPRIRGYHRF